MKDERKREVDLSVRPKDQAIEIKFYIHIVWYIRDYSINK